MCSGSRFRHGNRLRFACIGLLLCWANVERRRPYVASASSHVFVTALSGRPLLRQRLRVLRRLALDADGADVVEQPAEALSDVDRDRFALPERAASNDGSADQDVADDVDEIAGARLQLPLSARFGLAYTCGRCDVRNAISVNRIAWTSGVVVATCRGCRAKHLLADNEARLDALNDTGFQNIVQTIEAKGETVTKLDMHDQEALKALNLTVDIDGRLMLMDDDGTPPAARAPAPEVATTTSASTSAVDAGAEPEQRRDVATDDAFGTGIAEEDVHVDPLIVQLPQGTRQGDVLSVPSEFGVLHVPVPSGASAGCKLRVEGMVEVGLGKGWVHWALAMGCDRWLKSEQWAVGDMVAVNMPEGQVARIKIPECAALDATLRIAYPVAVLRSKL